MKYFRSKKGELTIGGIFLILIIGAGLYVGIKMVIPLVRYQQVKELFKQEVGHLKTVSEIEVKAVTLRQLKEMGIKLKPFEDFEDGLKISLEQEEPAYIEGEYEQVVNFIGGYKYKYFFHIKKVATWTRRDI